MKKTVFFDLDGTLSDSGPGIMNAIVYAQKKEGLRELSESELRSCIGPPLASCFRRLFGLSEEESEQLINVYREYYTVTGIFENTLYPGIRELLEKLKKEGVECRICSGKPVPMIQTVLNYFKLTEYFSRFDGAAMHGPYPGKAAFLSRALKEEPMQAVMVGDRRDDMVGAVESGIPGIGVLWGYGTQEELTEAGAARLVRTPEELAILVDKDLFMA